MDALLHLQASEAYGVQVLEVVWHLTRLQPYLMAHVLERGLDLAEASTVLQGKLGDVQLITSQVTSVLVLKRLGNNDGG